MNNSFYPKMAITNLKKNANIYFPYILTCICSIITFYIMSAIAKNKGLNQMPGGESICIILNMGSIVIGIFSVIFLFYTNSFLIKRRKKELGLYSILGMEKKHISKVLLLETGIVSAVSLLIGLMGGLLFSKLMFLLLLNLMNFSVSLKFSISFLALRNTIVLFLGIFFLTLIANLWEVKKSNAISLLKGGQQGEKEPKTKWILTLIGIVALGGGYYIALSVDTPLAALNLFFVAVILVIIGTYALFTAGSIALLKALKKRKSYYYQPKNFISVSGMIYRMKQNAVGLANICILSTMVLVILSTTVCLYIGKDDLLRTMYPKDMTIKFHSEEVENPMIQELIEKTLMKYKVKGIDYSSYRESGYIANHKDDSFQKLEVKDFKESGISMVNVLLLEDYNRIEGKEETLESNEVLLFSNKRSKDLKEKEEILLDNQTYFVKKNIDSLYYGEEQMSSIIDTYYLVVKDMEILSSICGEEEKYYFYEFDIEGNKENIIKFAEELKVILIKEIPGYISIDSIHLLEQQFYSMYGGFLFIGIFLGALFMMATVLIIYYKQISEGYDDHDRFEIMQKVGLSKKEVKNTIQKQILMVFFLPLAGAVIHMCFAFPVISKLLSLFGLTNITLFQICTLGTVLLFAVIYGIVYGWTAKIYYKLVQV